ncbi:hypothetical protein MVEN_00028200 [Mycena venus]|uniref:Uncharacterized protein n=1 Tax=Mycena venus TaxID=2733690 RepID=A0A8H6Z6E9_9AGAR|nr:hypothetical protein MVEN_00028200 [Mycena venus]
MKDLASLAEDASAMAVALSRLPTSIIDAPGVAKVKAQAEQMAAELAEVALADKRFHATRLTVAPRLRYSVRPNPEHVPGLPPSYLLRIFRNVQPPDSPGVLYESMVDRLACTFLGHYFPPTHQFLLQPQHTFRKVVPEEADALQANWSTTANDGEGSSRADLSAATEASAANDETGVSVAAPLNTDPYEPDPAFLLAAPRASSSPPRRPFAIPKPRADGPSRLERAALDTRDRLVDTTPAGLRKPDISIVYQGIPSQSDPKLVEQYTGLPMDAAAPRRRSPRGHGGKQAQGPKRGGEAADRIRKGFLARYLARHAVLCFCPPWRRFGGDDVPLRR